MQLLLVRVEFTFHIVNWGAFLRIRCMAFRIGSDLFAALMLLENIGSSSLCGFLDAFELQPLGLWNQKKSSLSVFSSIIWVSLPENYIMDRVAFVAFFYAF